MDGDAEPALTTRREGEGEDSVVGCCDALDDREPETDSGMAGTCASGPALERLDKRGEEFGRCRRYPTVRGNVVAA